MERNPSPPPLEKCKDAILASLSRLGGHAERTQIVEMAERVGGFSSEERAVEAPPSHRRYSTYLKYRLSWAITALHRDGLLRNTRRGWWQTTG